ncbi:protein of unknown function [Oenococcus oeni]|uniref:Uncharacterized protein n=1 Tax=Oenococcus oeni TaxID=1247 RepID=A0AAQ2USQ3_OENOE|nr:hypothetical protein OENI_540012 [Oenococcus oeni]SYW12903.1 hypothetical protein OENI_60003 [Oenococcus oeni]SYW13709.1 hypothetical protein OENI_1390002 [Oenococcus oeni]SYW17052.1 hypothetical protein OENI_80003 [Oenococcus oeni]SYW20825.1 hypothetical protein OENI_770013 [Oenococcus oeni]
MPKGYGILQTETNQIVQMISLNKYKIFVGLIKKIELFQIYSDI